LAAGAGAVWAVEGYAQLDLDLPAGDSHVFDDEAHELLALCEVEVVDSGRGLSGEIADALAQPVVGCELVSLSDQPVALVGERLVAGVDVFGAPLDVGQLEQSGLVEVSQASPLRAVGYELAFEACHFGVEELVVGRGR
jgi:hypothetical protein